MQPFTIVEDTGFCDLVDFFYNLNKKFTVPSRNTIQTYLMRYGELVQTKMKEKIQNEIEFFSTTTDIWSPCTMESFMAVTLDALTDNFDVINMTLGVDPLLGKHTANFIQTNLNDSFNEFDLKTEKLTLMLQDSASNAVKAYNDWKFSILVV